MWTPVPPAPRPGRPGGTGGPPPGGAVLLLLSDMRTKIMRGGWGRKNGRHTWRSVTCSAKRTHRGRKLNLATPGSMAEATQLIDNAHTESVLGRLSCQWASQGAGGGTRTHMGFRPAHCQWAASTSSATPAPPSGSWRPLTAPTQLGNARCPWPVQDGGGVCEGDNQLSAEGGRNVAERGERISTTVVGFARRSR